MPAAAMVVQQQNIPATTEAKDAVIAWFRGEFAAANAIIDALCGHIRQVEGGEDYESAFSAIHRRRLNWIPILQMQKYFSIADVTFELDKIVTDKKRMKECDVIIEKEDRKSLEAAKESGGESENASSGSQELQPFPQNIDICTNHEDCEARRAQIKMTKGFVAKEPVRGHMVNVVRGLKLYEDIFTAVELSKLNDLVNELRVAGQNGELSGETFISYNQQTKGNKRELIQLGVSIFGQIKQDATNIVQTNYIEPIPPLLQGVIEHFIQWRLIPENRKPNSCIINFFDEGEYSQPFLKPPHLDQPLSTLVLSESTMAFGRMLASDSEGNFRGPLMLSLQEGSLIVMRGNSSDAARHVMCSSPNKRVSITFFKVRTETENHLREIAPVSKALTLWQPGNAPNLYTMPNTDMIPKWGLVRAPMVMVGPVGPMVLNSRRMPQGGTGVFLPWNAGQRKPTKHNIPPRAQRGRFLALPSSADAHKPESVSDTAVNSP